jgi:hypothetical protein
MYKIINIEINKEYYKNKMTDKKQINNKKKKPIDDKEYEIKQILKMRDLENKGKIMIKNAKNIKVRMEFAETEKIKLSEEKKFDELLVQRDKLVKRIIAQRKIVADLIKKKSTNDSTPITEDDDSDQESKNLSYSK